MNYNLMPTAYAAAAADPFAKSPFNPLNMSRSGEKRTTGHAPSVRILERVREAAADLAVLATTAQGWKFVAEKNRTVVYEMGGRALPPTVSTTRTFGAGGGNVADFYLVRAVTTVHASIASVLAALQARTSDELEPKMRRVFGKHHARSVVVDELSCTTPPPFALDPESARGARRSFSDDDAYAVNWLALNGPSSLGGNEKMQDFTLVSYQDGFERQAAGCTRIGKGELLERASGPPSSSLMGVHVLSSVNFKDIPPLPAKSHSERQHLRTSGFVIEATSDPTAFRLSLFLSLLPTKATLKHARKYQKWLVSVAGAVGNVASAVASATPELSVAQLGPHAWKESDHCYLCLKTFRTFRRCHHCRLCGEAICSACSGFVVVATTIGGRGRSNSHSSVDMRSQYSSDDSDDGGSRAETRGCTVCLQTLTTSVAAASAAELRRKSSSSSFSASNSVDLPFGTSTSVASLAESYGDDSAISYGGDSDRRSSQAKASGGRSSAGASGGHASFQSYYDHRKRSTGATTTSSSSHDDSVSLVLKPHAGDYSSSHHHTVTSTPSMSTTSSSFSHDGDAHSQSFYPSLHSSSSNPDLVGWHQQQQQQAPPSPQSQPRIFSSEVSEGSDLSMDPEILALAGLTMKTSSSQYAQLQAAHAVMEEEDYDDDLDDSAASPFAPLPAALEAASIGRANSIGWAGAESVSSSTSSNGASASQPPLAGPAAFHFSVKANASASSATVPKSSVHAEIAALMLEDLAVNGPMTSEPNAPSGPYGRPQSQSQPQQYPPPRQHQQQFYQQQQQQPDRFYMSASSVASAPASHATGGFAPMGSALSQSRGFTPSASSNNTSHSPAPAPSRTFASSKIISAATLAASQHRAAASRQQQQQQQQQQQRLAASRPPAPQSDMILLSRPAPRGPEFVVFNDAQRESIFTRPDNGNDMIRLDF